jgi:6-phosphogluconolactonase/glucosamine-6-phosphate isomerase/deaminase
MIFKLSENSDLEIIEYKSIDELSEVTTPFVTKGIVGLSGGSTYDKLFGIWANQNIDISRANFLPVDERVVPFTHSDCNWRNACEKFFTPLGSINRVKTSPYLSMIIEISLKTILVKKLRFLMLYF